MLGGQVDGRWTGPGENTLSSVKFLIHHFPSTSPPVLPSDLRRQRCTRKLKFGKGCAVTGENL
ncbi:MAG: hypothetical protein LBI81_03555 [Puniceicoccales bacterium]|nr:hypothetical protein [Puniceicoccales bacterium]